jgi:hypothetical protein
VFRLKRTIKLAGIDVEVSEISFETYKSILKLLFRAGDPLFLQNNLNNLLLQSTNLTIEQIKYLNCIELMVLLIEIRILSVGAVLQIYVQEDDKKEAVDKTQEPVVVPQKPIQGHVSDGDNVDMARASSVEKPDNSKEEKKGEEVKQTTTLTKNLYNLQEDLITYNQTSLYTLNKLKICLKTPTLIQLNEDINIVDCVRWLEMNGKRLLFNSNQKEKFLESLPSTVTQEITKVIPIYFTRFESYTLIDVETKDKHTKINLSLSYDFLVHIIKLLFGDNLVTLHQNCFKLSQFAHIDLNYINNCSPGEAFMYMKILDSEIKAQNQLEQTQ